MSEILKTFLNILLPSAHANFLIGILREQRDIEEYAKSGNIPFISPKSHLLSVKQQQQQQHHNLYLDCGKVVEYGLEVIEHYKTRAGNEIWDIYEQTAIALMVKSRENIDSNSALEKAEELVKTLRLQFPDSVCRVGRLEGMLLESKGDLEKALGKYEAILDIFPTETATRKRIVATLIAKGKNELAIEALNEYLQVYMNDIEAWEMLADLYKEMEKFDVAAFCIEEILLLRPINWAYHVKYAEMQLAINTSDSVSIARKYYCRALELEPHSLEAMRGISKCAVTLKELTAVSGGGKKHQSADSDLLDQLDILIKTELSVH